MKKIGLLIGIAICAFGVLSGSGSAFAKTKTLKIGCLGPLSGGAAAWGIQLLRGLEMRVEEVNNSGGLKIGNDIYKIEVRNYDTQARADVATQVTKALVYRDKVKYIIGNAVGATCDAAQLVTEPNHVMFTFICWGIGNLGVKKPYSFREVDGALEVAVPFYEWLSKKFPDIKKVALISPNDTSGWDTAKGSELGAKKVGWDMVAKVYYQRGTVDFSPFVTKLLEAKPDAIDLCASPPGDAGLIAKTLKERGYAGHKFCISILTPSTYMSVAGDASDGTYVPLGWDLEGPQSPPGERAFSKKYRAKYHEAVGIAGLVNYCAAQVIFDAMQKAESVNVDKVIQALVKDKYQTIMGPVVIGGKKNYGINRQFLTPLIVSVYKGGKVYDIQRIFPED